ncbi:MAG: ArsC/Spx/MgsR family protein [Solirubrobacterales bacterium]
MAITVYEKPSCTTCRNLRDLLVERGVDFEPVEYQVEGLTEPELRGLLGKAGISPEEALRMREPGAKDLKGCPDNKIILAMVDQPALLQRPFVVNGDKAVLARPIERALEVL